MAPDLRTLLHESTRTAPPDRADVADLLRAGRRRVRRRRARRAGAGVAVAAVAAAATTAAVVLPGAGVVRLAPAGGDPVGPVVHLTDATEARPGTDYRLLTTYDSGNLDRANDRSFGPMLPDGSVLVQDGPHGVANASRWGILDPAARTTDWLPDPPGPGTPSGVAGADADRLVLEDGEVDPARITLWVLDLDTTVWTRVSAPTPTATDPTGGMGRSYSLDGDRLYVAMDGPVDAGAPSVDRHLWSLPLTSPTARLRDERVDLGDFDVTDGVLVYLPQRNRPTSQLHVRTLATGEERVVDTRSGERCNPLGLQRAGDRVALTQYCGTRLSVRDDRVQVVTLDGDPVVTVQDTDVEPGVLTGRFLTVNGARPLSAGAYAYDLERHRFLRLSATGSTWYGGNAGSGDRLAWSSAILDGRGRRTVFADLR